MTFPAQRFRERKSRILELYLGYSDLVLVWPNLNKRILVPLLEVLLELDFLETGPLQVDALSLLLLNDNFYLGILETVANIYFSVAVGLISMYVVNDFWRASS